MRFYQELPAVVRRWWLEALRGLWPIPFLAGALAVLLAGGCDDSHVHFVSCTNLHHVEVGTVPIDDHPHGCNGTVIVVVHDAPGEELSSFTVTIRRLELVSRGRVHVFFDGARREDVLAFKGSGFLLGRRDDVPEVTFDLVRLELADAEARFGATARSLVLARGGIVEEPLSPELSVDESWPQRLRIDLDLRETFASSPAEKAAGALELVIRAHGDDPPGAPIAVGPVAGTIARLEPLEGGLFFQAEEAAGKYWLRLPAAPPMGGRLLDHDGRALQPGERLILHAGLLGDGTLEAELLVIAGARAPGRR